MRSQSRRLAGLVGSTPRVLALSLASGVIAGILEYIIHTAATGAQLRADRPTLIDSAVMAFVTAILVYIAMAQWRARRLLLLQRLQTIAELNHNVRNALQRLMYSQYLPPREQTQAVLESVDRIESTLRELFPVTEHADNEQDRLQGRLNLMPDTRTTVRERRPDRRSPC